eukprot:1084345-Rhodomonas_salina.2
MANQAEVSSAVGQRLLCDAQYSSRSLVLTEKDAAAHQGFQVAKWEERKGQGIESRGKYIEGQAGRMGERGRGIE